VRALGKKKIDICQKKNSGIKKRAGHIEKKEARGCPYRGGWLCQTRIERGETWGKIEGD